MAIMMHLQRPGRTESMLRITTEQKRGKIFLNDIFQFSAGSHRDPCARQKQAECAAWERADPSSAADAGSGRGFSAETESDHTDRDFASRAERAGQKHRALGFAAAGECEDF